MIEPRMIAEYLCNRQPYSILNRLITDEDFISKYDLKPTVVITIGGEIHLNQHILIAAIKRLFDKKEVVHITDIQSNKHALSLDHGHINFESASKEIKVRLDNFFILSPDREERVKNISKLITAIGPISPDFSNLLAEAERGELSYEQIDELLHELSIGVTALQNKAKNAFNTQQATFENLIPSSLTYYDYFCGPNPGNADPEKYLDSILPNYRKELIQRNFVKGLDVCLQGALRDDLMPGAWIGGYSDNKVWNCLKACDPFRDPFALLGALDIALWRQSDERYRAFADDAVKTLVRDEFLRPDGIDVYKLMPSLAMLILNRINVLEGGALRPPYWKRMCAWMQAGFLIRQTQKLTLDIESLRNWISANMTQAGNFTALLDLRQEPMYRASDMTQESFREEVIGRLLALRKRHEKDGRGIQKSADIDDAVSKIVDKKTAICLILPGPLEGHILSSEKGVNFPEEGIKKAIENLFSDKTEMALSNLTYLSQLYVFGEELLTNIRKVIEDADFDTKFTGFPEMLMRVIDAAFIACSQQDKELSNTIGAKIVSASPWVNSDFTTGNIVQALLVAGAAFKEESEWIHWFESQLVEVAYRLPAGDNTKEFLLYIQELKKVLNLKTAVLSKAEAISSAAS